jgi:excinuclease ABC subunit C
VSRRKTFDQKFGPDFIASVPVVPGVYRVYAEDGALIYVGKAKNLRRRLGQYRNAKRFKKHQKMRQIVKSGERIEFEVCGSELDALLLEAKLIQEHRPKWNVAGAFYFLYPMLGIRREKGITSLCYTTEPEKLDGFRFHGAYRSRFLTGEAFFSLMKLLTYLGHRTPAKARVPGSYSYVYGFRQLPEEWEGILESFFRGESKAALESLILALVENAAARRSGAKIQEALNDLARFWRHEALTLARVRAFTAHQEYPVSQRERDLLFLKASQHKKSRPKTKDLQK